MAASINASTTAGVVTTADTSGVLNIQTANTTAISISASQVVSYTNNPTYSGGTANGVLYLNGSKVATSGSALVFDGTNLGLGVTPSAWSGIFNAIQGAYGGCIAFQNNGPGTKVGNNWYFNGTNYIYTTTNAAARYDLSDSHKWYIAPSGTAGNTISFTQAMTLDASGNLSLGTTSTTVWNGSAGTKVVVGGSGNTITSLQSSTTTVDQGAIFEGYATGISSNSAALGSIAFLRSNTSTTALSSYTAFYTNNAGTVAERARITSDGNLLVGTTSSDARLNIKGSGSTSSTWSLIVRNSASGDIVKTRDDGFVFLPSTYNNTSASAANVFMGGSGELYRSTSSLKYKTNVQDAEHGLADLLKLRSVTYEGKSENDAGKTFGGLIAEEVDAVGLTEFVQYAEDGTPDALAYGNMVSLCIKAIQEQQNLINTLNARIDALEGAKQ